MHLTQTRSWFQTWQNDFIFAYGRSLQDLRQSGFFDLATIYDEIMFFLGYVKSDIKQIVKDALHLEELTRKLFSKAKVGGEIVVDFYPIKGWYTKLHAKYMIRPITRRFPKPLLLGLIRLNIRWMLLFFDFLCLLRLGAFTRFIPITDVRLFPAELSTSQRREWAVMDTFDGLSPEYDNPQRLQDVVRMFTRGDAR